MKSSPLAGREQGMGITEAARALWRGFPSSVIRSPNKCLSAPAVFWHQPHLSGCSSKAADAGPCMHVASSLAERHSPVKSRNGMCEGAHGQSRKGEALVHVGPSREPLRSEGTPGLSDLTPGRPEQVTRYRRKTETVSWQRKQPMQRPEGRWKEA